MYTSIKHTWHDSFVPEMLFACGTVRPQFLGYTPTITPARVGLLCRLGYLIFVFTFYYRTKVDGSGRWGS